MTPFDRALKRLLGVEGEYSDHPDDSGGKTRWGITEAVAVKNGYRGRMRDYPIEEAKRVYKKDYWDAMGLGLICVTSEPIADELFDSGVNVGTGLPQVWLQRLLNVANDKGRIYRDVKVDGVIGPSTALALAEYIGKRGSSGEGVMLSALNGFQSVHYTVLAERGEKNKSFWFGWQLQRVKQ